MIYDLRFMNYSTCSNMKRELNVESHIVYRKFKDAII